MRRKVQRATTTNPTTAKNTDGSMIGKRRNHNDKQIR